MQEKIAIISIISKSNQSALKAVDIIHQYPQNVIGRLGLPVRSEGISIICVAMQAEMEILNQLEKDFSNVDDIKCSVLID